MRVHLWVLASCLTSFASAAGAQSPDAGSAIPPPPPAGCGTVTPEGECNGNTLLYCDTTATPNELVTFDCVSKIDPGAICQTISPEYGVDCALAPGTECVYADENDDLFFLFCQGAGAACVETATTSVCSTGIAACTEDEIGACRGDQAVVDCVEGQGWYLDCASLGGSCDTGSCVGIPEGGACGDGIECATGLVCDDAFTCAPAAPDAGTRDAGGGGGDGGGGGNGDGGGMGNRDGGTSADGAVSAVDSGSTSGAPDGGIPRSDAATGNGGGGGTSDDSGCSSMSGSASGFGTALIALLGFAVLRRRRA